MRKIVLILLFSTLRIALHAEGYGSMIKNINTGFAVGVGYTKLGIGNDNFKEDGMNVNMTCYGVYIDGAFCLSGNHKGSVKVQKWQNEKSGWAFHVGYQLPVCKWFRVVPNVGYINGSYGSTDGSDYTINSSGIHNSYTSYGSKFETKGIDYGLVAVFHAGKWVNFNIHANRHTPGVSICLDMSGMYRY